MSSTKADESRAPREFWITPMPENYVGWVSLNKTSSQNSVLFREVLPSEASEIERLKQELNELREAEKQWEPQWRSEAEATAAGYNQALGEIDTLRKQLEVAVESLKTLVVAVNDKQPDIGSTNFIAWTLDKIERIGRGE